MTLSLSVDVEVAVGVAEAEGGDDAVAASLAWYLALVSP